MKVLLATDGTKYGEAAADMMGKLSLNDGDEVKIICVVDMALPMAIDIYGGYIPDTTEMEKIARDSATKVVADTSEKVLQFFGDKKIDLTTDVLFGSPDGRIVETAEAMDTDLIVIGSHGYKQWERLLVGSISDSVVHHAHCSVMVVRTETK